MNYKNVFLFFIILFCSALYAENTISKEPGWFVADRVVAIVNSDPILESEVDFREELSKKRKETVSQMQIIDDLINDQLLYQAADQESILISDLKVDTHINELMQFYGVSTLEAFKKKIEKEEKTPYTVYREEVRKKLIVEQLMVYAMDYVPPSEAKAKEWYEQNKQSMLQVRFQHILIRPEDDTFTADKNANVTIEGLRKRIVGGESFGRLARQNSQDRSSASNNGVIGWTSFGEIDREIAGYVYQMKDYGAVSPVFKTPGGYHIIKYLGRRFLPYEEIRDRIFQMISQQARMGQFNEWVQGQRKIAEIRVFVEGYDEYRKKLDDKEHSSHLR